MSNNIKRYAATAEPVVYECLLDRNLAPGVVSGPTVRDAVIIECNEGGSGSVIINGREFPVKKGDCYILLPGDTVIYTADKISPRSGIYCIVGGAKLPHQLADVGITSESPFAPPETFAPIKSILYRILETKYDTDPGVQFRQMGMIYEIIGELQRYRSGPSQSNFCIRRALGILESHYNLPWTVAALASEVGLERSYFSVLFRKETGMTPHAYLNHLRILKACVFLDESDASIAEVAEYVGIPADNFSRLFRREMGVSPREWRS